ncbi:hypothetical protein EJ110_NYTH04883 [Nymphaea thermarum]|nr:hypothetical protein EJ110_NYTH04883 [Nymphaea thermarum]
MVTEASWFSRAGLNHVASALRTPWKKRHGGEKAVVGVLAFEVASLMSKIVHLWNSLSDKQIVGLRDELLALEGVNKLVSENEEYLLGLACAEMIDNLAFVVRSISLLGKKCTDVALQGFEHVFDDLVKNGVDLCNWEYTLKKMEKKAKKMERLISLTANLYQELEVLSELEQGTRRTPGMDDPNRGNTPECQRKVQWQRQVVKYLKESSLWNKTFDVIVKLLARSAVTTLMRIREVFGLGDYNLLNPFLASRSDDPLASGSYHRSVSVSAIAPLWFSSEINWGRFSSGPLGKAVARSGPLPGSRMSVGQQHRHQKEHRYFFSPATKNLAPSRPFRGCVSGGIDTLSMASDCGSPLPHARACNGSQVREKDGHFGFQSTGNCISIFSSKRKLLNPPPSSLGAAALALHYANVIILIEKMAQSPHLIGPDARNDLYSMLPSSVRVSLRSRLKSYANNLITSVYDPPLAAEWRDALARIIGWLAPLAHNMIKWQSERSFEQQHICSKTNVLLLQTLYFADKEKTESAITELLVGLNYLWRFQRELNAKALIECMSNGSFDDTMDSKA